MIVFGANENKGITLRQCGRPMLVVWVDHKSLSLGGFAPEKIGKSPLF